MKKIRSASSSSVKDGSDLDADREPNSNHGGQSIFTKKWGREFRGGISALVDSDISTEPQKSAQKVSNQRAMHACHTLARGTEVRQASIFRIGQASRGSVLPAVLDWDMPSRPADRRDSQDAQIASSHV